MAPRSYRLGKRQSAIDRARSRVITAAVEELQGGRSIAGFTIDAVAARADVARQTVYHHFGSKQGLIEAMFDSIADDSGLVSGISEVFSEKEPERALSMHVEVFCRFWSSHRRLFHKMAAMVVLDEDISKCLRERHKRRKLAALEIAKRIHAARSLHRFRTESHLAETIWALTGFETFNDLFEQVSDGSQGGVGEVEAELLTLSAMKEIVSAAVGLDLD